MLPHDHPTPAPVVEVLPGQPADVGARAVGDPQPRGEPHGAAGLPDPQVHLPVLRPLEALVVPADAFERVAPEDPEIDRVGRPGLAPCVEAGAADAEGARHRAGHRLLEHRHTLGGHDPAHVVGLGLVQDLDRGTYVVGREEGVAVHPYDDRMAGRSDGRVQAGRRGAAGVADRAHLRVLTLQLGGDLVGTVVRRAEGHHQLELARVVLRKNADHGLAQVPLLVQHGHHHADGRRRWPLR